MQIIKKLLSAAIFLIIFALVVFLTFSDYKTNYIFLSLLIAGGICGIFFLSFENRRPALRDIMPIVVLCIVASFGRVVFNFIPQVQPVTAIVIISGITFGPQTGFMSGALSALISNMYLGHGPWTPWQMLAWGTVGALAGLLGKSKIVKHPAVYCTYGFLAGFLYSMITDVLTISTLGQALNPGIVLIVFATGIVFNISHSVGNVIFLLLLFGTFNRKLERIKTKYGVLSDE